MDTLKKILVIRNDKIGDFMLAWPAFALLKNQYPQAEITALVPEYTVPLADQCEWIDKTIIDVKSDSLYKDIQQLSKKIKSNNYDLSISLFSETRTAAALWLAGIKTRIGPATKIAQIFLNETLKQKRSQSQKPEYEYNLDLIKHLIELRDEKIAALPKPPFLKFNKTESLVLKNLLISEHFIKSDTYIIFIHPGTGGSAINLSLAQYAELLKFINKKTNTYIVITAGPDELEVATKLSSLIGGINHHIHSSVSGLVEFCKIINIADLFISGSTGPLHIAGALDINTTAFYPARKSATSLRWKTLNSDNKNISFSPEKYTGENDMQQIDIQKSAELIIKKFLS